MNHAAGENSARVWLPEAMASCRERKLARYRNMDTFNWKYG